MQRWRMFLGCLCDKSDGLFRQGLSSCSCCCSLGNSSIELSVAIVMCLLWALLVAEVEFVLVTVKTDGTGRCGTGSPR